MLRHIAGLLLLVSVQPAWGQAVTYSASLEPGVFTNGGSVIELSVEIQGAQATFSVRKFDGNPIFQNPGTMTLRSGVPEGCVANCNEYQWSYPAGVEEVSNTFDLGEYFTAGTKRLYASIGLPGSYCDSTPPVYYSGALEITASGEGIDVLDLACTSESCDGQYLEDSGPDKDTLWAVDDPEILALVDQERSGAVADGISLLLLRVRTNSPITFSVRRSDLGIPQEGEICPWGYLSERSGNSVSCSEITVTPEGTASGESYAYAIYQAPDGVPFTPPNTSGIVIIKASGESVSDAIQLRLINPPVVMLHGLWSMPDVWNPLAAFLGERGIDVCANCRPGYDDINGAAGSFDPLIESETVARLEDSISNALNEFRSLGFVASRVDLVGHSMGGIIARAFESSSHVLYNTPVNRNFGYIRRLITIGTPHHGSPVLNWLVLHRNDDLPFWFTGDLEGLIEDRLGPFGPALEQLQDGSQALQNIGESRITSHAIIGLAPQDSAVEAVLNRIPAEAARTNATMDCILGGQEHDTLVTIQSQEGGVSDSASSTFEGIVHSEIDQTREDITETESEDVLLLVSEILLGTGENPTGNFANPLITPELQERLTQCDNGEQEALGHASGNVSGAPGKVSIYPSPGTVVSPGEEFTVEFHVENPDAIRSVMFSIEGRIVFVDQPGPFVVSETASDILGTVNIYAVGISDTASSSLAVETYVINEADLEPSAIVASPGVIQLRQVGRSYPITARGEFGSETYDITDAIDTSYSVGSASDEIVRVSEEGIVTAQGPGSDTIVVANGGLESVVTIEILLTNQPPEIDSISPFEVAAGTSESFSVTSSDPDADEIVLYLSESFDFVSLHDFGDGSGELTVSPSEGDVGAYVLALTARDLGSPPLISSTLVSFVVLPRNSDVRLIDIKPDSDTNPINPNSNGKTPVAILSSPDFNAPEQVVLTSLTFGHTGDEESLHYKGNGEPNCSVNGDHNGDGLADIKCHFHTAIAGFQPGDTEGILRGETIEGETFEGRDIITIVGQGHDSDVDGVDDETEDGAPNNGDGNNDGTADSQQVNVTSTLADDGSYLTLASSPECTNTAVTTVSTADLPLDTTHPAPLGYLSFTLTGCATSDTAVYYFGGSNLSNAEYRRFGPTVEILTDHWYSLPAQFGSTQIDGQTVTTASFQLTDGGLGDDDLTVNGEIVDPGGPGIPILAPTVDIPALDKVGLGILMLLITAGALLLLLRRR